MEKVVRGLGCQDSYPTAPPLICGGIKPPVTISMYLIRKFENGGILVSDKKPQVVKEGRFAGVTKLDGKRFQISSLPRMVENQLHDAELTEAAQEYINALNVGDYIGWADGKGELENVVVTIDGERVTLTRKWANVDLNKAFAAVEAFVEAEA